MYRIQDYWSGGGKLENYQGEGKGGKLSGGQPGKIARGATGANKLHSGGIAPFAP